MVDPDSFNSQMNVTLMMMKGPAGYFRISMVVWPYRRVRSSSFPSVYSYIALRSIKMGQESRRKSSFFFYLRRVFPHIHQVRRHKKIWSPFWTHWKRSFFGVPCFQKGHTFSYERTSCGSLILIVLWPFSQQKKKGALYRAGKSWHSRNKKKRGATRDHLECTFMS